ncbi:MAG: DUF1993 domain-containing protein [Pseudomonadota bacterium]|nr:DUF1993 domain-containing protein [Pseudomonadota bacterium]MEE3101592.1 DUF1993 domain-containing protein [Pseudomonadota bacterium]
MGVSLYDVSVATYRQALAGVTDFMGVAETHFAAQGEDLDALCELRLIEDMAKFRFQIVSVHHHSAGALAALKSGEFSPPSDKRRHDWAGLKGLVEEAKAAVEAATREEIEAAEGRDVTFRMGEVSRSYTAPNFILSFSLPNVFFHATTAYDLLRAKGAPIGKRNFSGPHRVKG